MTYLDYSFLIKQNKGTKVVVPLFAFKCVFKRNDFAVSDPTSTGGRSNFCRQIHRSGRSDRTPSLFREVTPSSAIQLILGDDCAFTVRSIVLERSDTFVVWRYVFAVNDPTSTRGHSGFCHQIHRPGTSDQISLSFGKVTLPSVIQLLLRDDLAFAVRSITLVGAIGHLRRLER
ncbi:hypothetical protein E5676_scaffold3734G00460 [Cucumis melo var. makuwa]|uniref:Uncharacterized protein n=1 Tax=Cucumis melo var. makuwa TaxID=1194695 RepID=A0A5D3CE35_CUCMM|nr:hypothetical protein E6C27_scaffold24G004550 [Cucumis melo var. makuwa]TYK08616.1 hypothetical protein E5676_scaffold3734G00460 [Cucumis melo var. makuwa]